MKHVVIIGDGMAGYPLEELEGRTPLQVADTPNMDWIASKGRTGRLKNVPDGMEADSDVAIMSILSYDPREYYTGRGPLEAAGMDIELGDDDVAFRCNLITIRDGLIEDYSADHVSTEEAEELLDTISEEYADVGDFYVGVDYRHLFILEDRDNETDKITSYAPHKHVGEEVENNLLEPGDLDIVKTFNEMMLDSKKVLSDHSINRKREEQGKGPANAIWVWGHGKKPDMEPLSEKYGISGAVISAVTLVKGLGVCAGMDKIDVPGATGYYDTNYENKAEYGLEALEGHDLILIHVEAPDEAGHSGDLENKIRAIEDLDSRLISQVRNDLESRTDFSISIMADHPTPIKVENHVGEPVPFAFCSTKDDKDNVDCFDEKSVRKGSVGTLDGFKFMDKLFSSVNS